jgi:hypothetical protein
MLAPSNHKDKKINPNILSFTKILTILKTNIRLCGNWPSHTQTQVQIGPLFMIKVLHTNVELAS